MTFNNLTKDHLMAYKQSVIISKERRVLNNICKDCGRSGKIPTGFCTECWKEMEIVINKKGNNND